MTLSNLRFAPHVISTTPINGAVQVPTSMIVSARLSHDLDRNYIEGNVLLTDAAGNVVTGRVTYAEKILSFRPDEALATGTAYVLTLVGDMDPEDAAVTGIRSVLGEPMAGDFKTGFVTVGQATLPAPRLIWPLAGGVLTSTADFFVEWAPVPDAANYELVLSASNTFEPVIYPPQTQPLTTLTKLTPAGAGDGLYYMRVRAIRADGAAGNWTPPATFRVDRAEYAPITADDSLPADPADAVSFPGNVISSFPEAEFGNVGLNLRVISLVVDGFAGTAEQLVAALQAPGAVELMTEAVDTGTPDDVPKTVTVDTGNTVELSPGRFQVVLQLAPVT